MDVEEKKLNFEERMQRLQDIVSSMERGDIPLNESVTLFKEGMQLSKDCRTELEHARHEIRLITHEGEQEFLGQCEQEE